MKRIIKIVTFLIVTCSWSQVDYSNNWEDFYSYNNVKNFIKVENEIYAIVDNAIFRYDTLTNEIVKISSVNGLSGENTVSIHYSKIFNKIVIGYENGLIEIIDGDNNITSAKDIVNFNFTGNKQINSITEYNNKLYLSTSFAIVVYDIENLQFGDTYFIGSESSEVNIYQIEIVNNTIYAATKNGIYTADISNKNLIDFNNWTLRFLGNYTTLENFNNKLYTSINGNLFRIENNSLVFQKAYPQTINNLKASQEILAISTQRSVYALNANQEEILSYTSSSLDQFYFNLRVALVEGNILYLGTEEFGILKSDLQNISDFEEIHPEGPVSNLPFSINVKNNNLWVVYGGYDSAYTPGNGRYSFSHFNGENWFSKPYSSFNVKNLVNITFDYKNENKVYLSSWGASNPNDINNTGGLLVVENDEVVDFWNYTNSGLENLIYTPAPTYISTRINGSAFDSKGNLWIANAWVNERIKKYSANGTWSSFDMSAIMTNPALGLNELIVDKTNTIWLGSRRNGVLVFNETGEKKKALTTEFTNGSLPDANVRTIATDANNRVWIGTKVGLVVLNNATNIFNETNIDAEPIIILDDGIPKKLLGDQTINSIAVDGADNKWFGTELGGVLQTNPNGTTTLQNFNKNNSPLPSNTILKIAVDSNSGKVYFATSKGIVAYNSSVASYGESLTEVYAYPNPSTKNNEFITIDGRNGTHLPNGTTIKIVDTAGNLVFETSTKEGQELYGGKVVWDKTNLSGTKVASGVYIVLLIANDNTETAITKIAIIN